jgi:hypothetical protein
MDDILINPDFYDLFAEPALAILLALWLVSMAAMRLWSERATGWVLLAGMSVIFWVAWQPVLTQVIYGIPVLTSQTQLAMQAGSADPLRDRDPIFQLLRAYRDDAPAYPLAIVEDPHGEAARWARYYLYPRQVVSTTAEAVAGAAPGPDDPPRDVLSLGMPAFPASIQVSLKERHDNWVLFQVRQW